MKLGSVVIVVASLVACKGKTESSDKVAGGSAVAPTANADDGCKPLAVCTLLPLDKVNTLLGVQATAAVPRTTNDGGRMVDACTYQRNDTAWPSPTSTAST